MNDYTKISLLIFVSITGCVTRDSQIPTVDVAPSLALNANSMKDYRFQGDASLGANPEYYSCHTQKTGKFETYSLQYLDCNNTPFSQRVPTILTKNFSIDESIKPRVWFWHQIYSRYGSNKNVLHAAEYPEVILEVVDLIDNLKQTTIDRILKERTKYYKNILKQMAQGKQPEDSDIANRITQNMAHISDENKYQIALDSIRFQRGQKTFIAKGIQASSEYLPIIEKEFMRQGIPSELASLAFVESSFNLKARSKVNASGVYQIMPFVAKKIMVFNKNIDERSDPIKAGKAAAIILRNNFKRFNQWPLAVTSYNHGPNGVRPGVKKVGSNKLIDLIHNYEKPSFGFASKNFYSSFLGMIWTLKETGIHFEPMSFKPVLAYRTHRIKRATSLRKIARIFRTSTRRLLQLNPDIKKRMARSRAKLPKKFVIKLPGRRKKIDRSPGNSHFSEAIFNPKYRMKRNSNHDMPLSVN